VVHSRDVQDCGGTPQRKFTLKPAKIPYITIWQYWIGNLKPKKAFRLILNAFKKLLLNFNKNLFNGIFYWLTDWLTNCQPASQPTNQPDAFTRVTQQWLRLGAWFFRCSMLLQPERCSLPYRCTYNAFFMDLPQPSYVYHSSLLTTKSFDFVIGMYWFPLNHPSGYFDYKSLF